MSDEVKKAGLTWQTGSQQRSNQYFRVAAEFVCNGRLGKRQGITVRLPGRRGDWNQMGSQQDPKPVPEGLNYDLWEGPVPHREYFPALLPLNWRHNWDYSGGMATDSGAHHIDIVQWALDMDESEPVTFDNIKEAVPDQKSIFVTCGSLKIEPREMARDKIKDSETWLYASKNHYHDFIDAVYSGGATVAPIEAAHRIITVSHLANLALRLGKSGMKWDLKTEKSSDVDINQMLTRPMREPYRI